MAIVRAVFAQGVFTPTAPVALPEDCEVEFEPRIRPASNNSTVHPPVAVDPAMARIYDVLGERYESGHADTAARHNEHQP